MASDITVTSLTAVGGVGQIMVSVMASSPVGMSCLPYMQPAAVKIYSATSDNFGVATLAGTVNSAVGVLVIGGLSASVTRYFWAVAVDPEGNEGARYPAGGGVAATTLTTQPGPDSVGTTELKNGAVTNAKMANLAVDNAKIANLAVDDAKIANMSAGKITAGTISAAISITSPSITGGTITGSTVRTSSGANRVEMSSSDNELAIYSSGIKLSFIGPVSASKPSLQIYGNGGAYLTVFETDITAGSTIATLSRAGGSGGHGFRGESTGGGRGIVGVASSAGGQAFYAEAGGYAPFTGVHDALLANGIEVQPGEIVCSTGRVVAKFGVDDALLEVEVASTEMQRGAYGIVRKVGPFDPYSLLAALPPLNWGDPPTPVRQWIANNFQRLAVNGCGEGLILVCGRGGNIAIGDYICCSSMRGKGQRQNDASGDADDLLRRHTVAQATQAFEFDDPDQVQLIACIYKCG